MTFERILQEHDNDDTNSKVFMEHILPLIIDLFTLLSLSLFSHTFSLQKSAIIKFGFPLISFFSLPLSLPLLLLLLSTKYLFCFSSLFLATKNNEESIVLLRIWSNESHFIFFKVFFLLLVLFPISFFGVFQNPFSFPFVFFHSWWCARTASLSLSLPKALAESEMCVSFSVFAIFCVF